MSNYIIIGGSSGMGLEVTNHLAHLGNRVFATYHTHPIVSNNASISYHLLNVLEDSLDFSFLPDTIDGILYCPGAIQLRPFGRITPSDFISDFNLQVVGAIKCIQSVLGHLKKGNHPSIVLFSTVAVQTGLNFHTQVSVSKGAIEGLTKSLAAELAPTIRVNCIAPGLTNTPLAANLLNTDQKMEANALRHPLKRVGTVQDMSHMIEFLLSDKSSWMTGQILHLDGGMSTIKTA